MLGDEWGQRGRQGPHMANESGMVAVTRDSHSPGSLGKSEGTRLGRGQPKKSTASGIRDVQTTACKVTPEPKCDPKAKKWRARS